MRWENLKPHKSQVVGPSPTGAVWIHCSTCEELSLISKLIHNITAESESLQLGIHKTIEEFAESTFDMSTPYL